jgi:hypothetical protein
MGRTARIDPLLAISLHERGWSWTDIGVIMAAAINRRTPFLGPSVYRAVRAYDRRSVEQAPGLLVHEHLPLDVGDH